MSVGKIFLIADFVNSKSPPLFQDYVDVQAIVSPDDDDDKRYTRILFSNDGSGWLVKAPELELRKAFEKANAHGSALMATVQALVDTSEDASRDVLILGPEVRLS